MPRGKDTSVITVVAAGFGSDADEVSEEKIKDVQGKAPKFGNSLTGYGVFFEVWLGTLKDFYKL